MEPSTRNRLPKAVSEDSVNALKFVRPHSGRSLKPRNSPSIPLSKSSSSLGKHYATKPQNPNQFQTGPVSLEDQEARAPSVQRQMTRPPKLIRFRAISAGYDRDSQVMAEETRSAQPSEIGNNMEKNYEDIKNEIAKVIDASKVNESGESQGISKDGNLASKIPLHLDTTDTSKESPRSFRINTKKSQFAEATSSMKELIADSPSDANPGRPGSAFKIRFSYLDRKLEDTEERPGDLHASDAAEYQYMCMDIFVGEDSTSDENNVKESCDAAIQDTKGAEIDTRSAKVEAKSSKDDIKSAKDEMIKGAKLDTKTAKHDMNDDFKDAKNDIKDINDNMNDTKDDINDNTDENIDDFLMEALGSIRKGIKDINHLRSIQQFEDVIRYIRFMNRIRTYIMLIFVLILLTCVVREVVLIPLYNDGSYFAYCSEPQPSLNLFVGWHKENSESYADMACKWFKSFFDLKQD